MSDWSLARTCKFQGQILRCDLRGRHGSERIDLCNPVALSPWVLRFLPMQIGVRSPFRVYRNTFTYHASQVPTLFGL